MLIRAHVITAKLRNNTQMLAEERRRVILDRLRIDGRVVATHLGLELGVSHDTIRRDLQELEADGLLQRVHGGALGPSATARSYAFRQHEAPAAKRRLANAAIGLLRSGQVIVLGGGTTIVQVAVAIPDELAAEVFTNSPPVAIELAPRPQLEVHLLGGRTDPERLLTLGSEPVQALRDLRADVCVISAHALDAEGGVRVCTLDEAQVLRAMIAASADVVALVTKEKLGTTAPYRVAPISELTHLVTEAVVSQETLDPYVAHGITVVRA
jgi:DeoR/GlpR family transcriptional regulator of sugar metabolism